MFEDFRLRVFTTIVQCGSFTTAARELNISQSAVSQHIAELEKTLNTTLFQRNHRSVELTDSGKLFLDYAHQILYWYSAAESMFPGGDNTSQKLFRIGVSPEIKNFIIVPAGQADNDVDISETPEGDLGIRIRKK